MDRPTVARRTLLVVIVAVPAALCVAIGGEMAIAGMWYGFWGTDAVVCAWKGRYARAALALGLAMFTPVWLLLR